MESYEERLRGALVAQHKKCFDYATKALKPEYAQHIDCPVCGSKDFAPQFEKDWFRFVRCRHCSMIYLNPRLIENATYDFYNSTWNAVYNERKFETETDSSLIDDRINLANLELIRRANGAGKGTLLEIGSGKGFFLSKAKEAGYRVYGVELNEKNCARARLLVGDTVTNQNLFDAKYPDGMFDVVYMRDVFEHVPNPKELLAEIHRVLKTDALLYIEVPNIEGLIYPIVKYRHVCIFGFEHLNYWSPHTLGEVLRRAGFVVLSVHHESLDFTITAIASHFLWAPEHTVNYPNPRPWVRLLARLVAAVSARQPVKTLDEKFTPWIANVIRRGSVIKVLARKATDAS